MHTKKIFSTLLLLSLLFQSLMAQLKVVPVGRVHIGNEYIPIAPSFSPFDPGNLMTMSLFGRGTDPFRVGAKLSFGDIGNFSLSGINVFVGENGTSDSDQLQLHGKDGLYFTVGGQGTTEAARIEQSRDFYVSRT